MTEKNNDQRAFRAETVAAHENCTCVPEGWKLVPVEPTWQMIDAGRAVDKEYSYRQLGPECGIHCADCFDHWAVMLAAAPAAPTEGARDADIRAAWEGGQSLQRALNNAGVGTAVAASAVEDMIAACVPGGSICDPQVVADAIRGYFAAQTAPAMPPLSELEIHAAGGNTTLALVTRYAITYREAYEKLVESLEAQPAPASGDEREAFEAWAHKEGYDLRPSSIMGYLEEETRDAWEGWQASAAHRREDQRENPGDEEC